MDEIEAAITRAADAEGAKGLDERDTMLLEKALRIAIDVEKRFGRGATDYTDRAIKALENARRKSDPERQAKIDASIEHAKHRNHYIDLDTRIMGLAFSLAGEFGGQPVEYMMRAGEALRREEHARKKEMAGVQQ